METKETDKPMSDGGLTEGCESEDDILAEMEEERNHSVDDSDHDAWRHQSEADDSDPLCEKSQG